jgi:DNA repair protein SbcD/Mre11
VKIVHTSDWHAGRVWRHRFDRLPELDAVLDHLAGYVERETIDLVLVTGDVFDGIAPPARAEAVVNHFFRRIGIAGARSVVIAGNHDSATRLEAWGELAELVGVHVVGRPRHPDRGGVYEMRTWAGERAVIAAVPFAAPRTLVSALQRAHSDGEAMQTYADGLRAIVALCSRRFRPDAVNLLCLHTHLDGAVFSGSERRVHLGDEWAATPQALPAGAHYIALGHIHRPQRVTAPAPAEYAGSPLQLDFGEAGQHKSFVRIHATPGQPAKITRVPYRGGRELVVVRATLDELTARREALSTAGWLKVIVQLAAPDPDLGRKVHALLDNVMMIDVECPAIDPVAEPGPTLRDASPIQVYRAWFEREHGRAFDPALEQAFSTLLAEEGAM